MGTKHNYTEKECKVCGVTKSRDEFPTYGGLTCRDCMREKEAQERPNRYQRDKQNQKFVEENRRRAREYKRKKKAERERENQVSVAESAAQLRAAGEAAAHEIAGVISAISTDLDAIAGKLQQAQTIAENSTNVAAQVLGESHGGTEKITGAAAMVVEKVAEVQALVSQFGLEVGGVTERGGVLSQTFTDVANALMM